MGHNRNWKLPALILAIAIVLHGGITNAYAASGKITYIVGKFMKCCFKCDRKEV